MWDSMPANMQNNQIQSQRVDSRVKVDQEGVGQTAHEVRIPTRVIVLELDGGVAALEIPESF